MRSSVAIRLGIPEVEIVPVDRRTDDVFEMMLNAVESHNAFLTPERLFRWQAALFPTGHSGLQMVNTVAWRNDAHRPRASLVHNNPPLRGRQRTRCARDRRSGSGTVGGLWTTHLQRIESDPEGKVSILRRARTLAARRPLVADWLVWFLGCFSSAIDGTDETLGKFLLKTDFWQRFALEPFTKRQKKVPTGFSMDSKAS